MPDIDRRLRQLERHPPSRAASTRPAPTVAIPNVIDFVTSSRFLARSLYPRQATLLKIICLEVELLTDYDLTVIAEWEAGFELVRRDGLDRYEGQAGLAPGTVARMHACRAEGRWWFREVVLVLGRRAGKGYLSALVTTYLLWRLLALQDPQEALGLERTKQLLVMTMAADHAQAASNQHRDIAELVRTAPCFAPYLSHVGATGLRLRTPRELAADLACEGSVLVEARPATGTAGRGPATVGFVYDEMAHGAAPGLLRSADEIYRSATPSLAQFSQFSLTLLTSSPASQTGEFFAAYRRALDVQGGQPVDPTMITVQLPSWAAYLDWDLTGGDLAMYPGGPPFPRINCPIMSKDDLERESAADPDRYSVEFLAQWRSSLAAYLDPVLVENMFGDYRDEPLHMQTAGRPGHTYVLHADPSVSGANFGVALGHLEPGSNSETHVVFDYLHAFRPSDFPDGRINYAVVEARILDLIHAFAPERVTFDQYTSEQMIQNLNAALRDEQGFGHTVVTQRVAHAGRNLRDAEQFKTLLGQGLVHAPAHHLAEQELLFLEWTGGRVDHPHSGPVRSKDIVDAIFSVVAQLTDGSVDTFQALTRQSLRGALPGGLGGNGDNGVFEQLSRHPPRDHREGNPARGRSMSRRR